MAVSLWAPGARALTYNFTLSAKLKRDFGKTLSQAESGKKLLERFEKIGAPFPEILIRKDRRDRFAFYAPGENRIYFNSGYVLSFFAVEEEKSDAEIVEIFQKKKEAREEWVKYADAVFVHEFVHALQNWRYANFAADVLSGNMTEFEHEAYLTEDLYFHQKMKNNPEIMKKFLNGEYWDPYTEHSMASYLNLSLDIVDYRENIRRRYERNEGYESMDEIENRQKSRVENERIIAYASGKTSDYLTDIEKLKRIGNARKDYEKFIGGFYEKVWPSFSVDALKFIGETALEVKNYSLALQCFAQWNVKSGNYPRKELLELKRKSAVAVLEAADFIKDNAGKMDIETLSRHLKALDEACLKTGRVFPFKIRKLREKTYKKAIKHYIAKASGEKDEDVLEYYRENIEFFARRLKERCKAEGRGRDREERNKEGR